MVDVQERGAEEHRRRRDERGERRGDLRGVLGIRAQRDVDDPLCDEDREREGGEPAENVHVVGPCECETSRQRAPDRQPLDERRGHGQADEGQPRETGEDEQRDEEREGQEDEEADEEGLQSGTAPERDSRDRGGGDEVRGGEQEPTAEWKDDVRGVARKREHEQVHDRDEQADQECRRRPAAVEPNRLRDELPDRTPLRRQRRRQFTPRLLPSPRHAAA